MSEADEIPDRESFALDVGFQAASSHHGLALGPLELQYQELFAEVLEDGIITEDERQRLERAAANLGLSKERLDRLEQAMRAAYETHHRVRVVDQTQRAAPSLSPLVGAGPLSGAARAPQVDASGPAASTELLRLRAENDQLRARVAALSEELARAQASVHIEVDLSDLDAQTAQAEAPADVWRHVNRAPLDTAALRALAESYRAHGQPDGAYLVAQALVALGAGNESERTLYETHRQTSLITPKRALDESIWRDCLFHPEEELTTGAIFSVVAPAILVGRVTTLRRDGLLKLPDPAELQEVDKSTIMSVRAVGWASALLGLPCPRVYLARDLDAGFVPGIAIPPYTLVGRKAQSGRNVIELSFLAGRHLSGYRGEHFVRTMFSATEDLEDLFLSALLIANPKLHLQGAKRARIEPLARAIELLLEPSHLDALRGHYLRFAEEGGRTNLMRFGSASEKTACRVGLALCQDVPTALRMVREADGPESPLGLDLITYATSSRFLTLRKNLGVALSKE